LVPRLRRLGVIVIVLVAVGAVVAMLFGPLISAFTTTYPTPRINIQAGSDTAGLGMLVQFTASVAAGRDLTFAWTFSDGQTADGNPVSHAFQQYGQQSTRVVATDPIGQTAQAERSVTILPPAPHAVFQVTTSYTMASFDASSSAGDNLMYSWDFGDGTTGTATTPLMQHDYRSSCRASSCTYTVALRVVDAAGQSDVFQSQVTVSAR
jgi:PKD repeat protein